MKKRNLAIIVILLLLLGIWSPWDRWNFSVLQLLGLSPGEQMSSLQVVNLAGRVQIYIDGDTDESWVVDAEDEEPLFIPAIESCEHQVKVVRLSDNEAASYAELNKLIYFAPSLAVTISYELGPSADFSGGHIIYARSALDTSGNAYLTVASKEEGLLMTLDGGDSFELPVSRQILNTSMQHNIKIEKEGYESQEFTILPADNSEREKLKGFELVVDVDLFLRPIPVY
jgi:hypothetical protein